jgi:cytochrome c553
VTAKKIALLLVLATAVLAVLLVPAVALANMGPHGGYISDTEACAGCHRAHTAPSSITWVDTTGATKSALLFSDAATIELFCLACHDNTSQGADTNVLDGIYEGTLYGTNGGTLLGGAFGRVDPNLEPGFLYDGKNQKVTSTHLMNGESWAAWGGGAFGKQLGVDSTASVDATGNYPATLGAGNKIVMDCGTCHDPHGSSNYRILKDVVYGVSVGGYDGTGNDPDPTPFVLSRETGFPQGGFRLHNPYAGYVPNYTSAKYAVSPGGDPLKGMSGWCTGCHTVYMTKTSTYEAADGFGFVERHRHPINVPLTNFAGPRSLVVTDLPAPMALAHLDGVNGSVGSGSVANTASDWIECLTCHNAHGASTTMTGWANVADPANDLRVNTGEGGVPPTHDSALLKLDNRGVCETCHNK